MICLRYCYVSGPGNMCLQQTWDKCSIIFLQRILWRTDPEKPVEVFTLNTVTYGTGPAAFLAVRCLRELANQEREKFTAAAEVLERDFYMDDVLSGADTIEEAMELQRQLAELLERGRFHLRKWRSNDPAILEHLNEEGKAEDLLVLQNKECIKTLGLLWNSCNDTLQYEIHIPEKKDITKRAILSTIARTYNPLGIIGPVIMRAKLFLQNLWKAGIDWDLDVSDEMETNWEAYLESLKKLKRFVIPRNTTPEKIKEKVTLHGFSDASEKGFGACVYICSKNKRGQWQLNLLCSKSKVAPLKTLTIPRLELNAALLLAKLVTTIGKALGEKLDEIHLWSDSSIALYWISTPPSNLQTFVANRVVKIQELTQDYEWHHVPSKDNAADVLSRGTGAEELMSLGSWWHGPSWLHTPEDWPTPKFQLPREGLELKTSVNLVSIKLEFKLPENISRFSKMRRIVAYCRRYIDNLRRARDGNKTIGPLSVDELDRATLKIIELTQGQVFADEIKDLKAGKMLNHRSMLNSLKPFIDKENLMRVGGRLRHAQITEEHRHPIVLPSRHRITEMIMREEHQKLLHCGANQLLSSI